MGDQGHLRLQQRRADRALVFADVVVDHLLVQVAVRLVPEFLPAGIAEEQLDGFVVDSPLVKL